MTLLKGIPGVDDVGFLFDDVGFFFILIIFIGKISGVCGTRNHMKTESIPKSLDSCYEVKEFGSLSLTQSSYIGFYISTFYVWLGS